jgi:hypothetical protein
MKNRSFPNQLIRLFDEDVVAEMLGVAAATVRRWRLLQQGPRYLKVGSSVRYRPEDLNEYLNTRPTGGEATGGARVRE